MSTRFVLSIDQGTTGTRAVVYDDQGRNRGTAARELKQHYPQPGWVEHDPEEIWQSVADVTPRALAAAITALHPDDMSPREAMDALYRLKELLGKAEKN